MDDTHMGDTHMRVTTEALAEAVVVRLAGDLDLATAREVTAALEDATARIAGERLVLDMTHVGFIDSTGLRVLLRAATPLDRPMVLVAPSGPVCRILDLTRLRGRFDEVASLDEFLGAGNQ
jgi:anti-sigma B factor antagonist